MTQRHARIGIEYSITVFKVTNISETEVLPGQRVQICWQRNGRKTETAPVKVVDSVAVFEAHSLKMIARMDCDAATRRIVSKVTQFTLRVEGTDRVLASIDFDLAAYANLELYHHELKMHAVSQSETQSTTNQDASLESLLIMTEDSFELTR